MAVGKFRKHAELRKKPRRQLHYSARILTNATAVPRPCAITDISESGARLVVERDKELPDRFVLLLTGGGKAHRRCRVVWRRGAAVGVQFIHRL